MKDKSKLCRAVTRWVCVSMVAFCRVDKARKGLRIVELAATKDVNKAQSRQKLYVVVAIAAWRPL